MRTLTVDDLFHLEQLGRNFGPAYAVSPSGEEIAFVLQRSKATADQHKWVRLRGNDRADIWLAGPDGTQPMRLTDGFSDSTGFWSPGWSPDGERLAMLSTRGDNATLWLWERATGGLRQLDPRGVVLDLARRSYVWLSPRHILCPLLPNGQRPHLMSGESRAMDAAMQAWPMAWQGKVPTASVLESGTSNLAPGQSEAGLFVVDVVDRTSRRIAGGLTEWSITQVIAVSPDLRLVAFLHEAEAYHLEPAAVLDFDGAYRFSIRIAATGSNATHVEAPRIGGDVVAGSLQWSPDSTELAYVDYRDGRSRPPFVRSIRPYDGATHTFGTVKLDADRADDDPRLRWAADGTLLVYAAPVDGGFRAAPDARRDWWRVERTGDMQLLTAALAQAPAELYAEPGFSSFIALSGGDLWRVYADGRLPTNLTPEATLAIIEIAWPPAPATLQGTSTGHTHMLVNARQDDQAGYFRVDLPTATVRQLVQPAPGASLVYYKPESSTVLWTLLDETGTYLWANRPDDLHLLWEGNSFLREVALETTRPVQYRGLDGQPLRGWLLLPPDYTPDHIYPLVVEVSPGTVYGPPPSWRNRINHSLPLGPQVLVAQGYVVLFPSMPAAPDGIASDPLLDLPNGVLPAVEQVIVDGIADPERIYLIGHSYGGYGVYGLLTLTNRFRAAVALGGAANLTSEYGSFDPRLRFEATAHQRLFMPALLEAGQGRMGRPPWLDAARYFRNSPLLYADRVQTPLMIIHGDMDYVAMQQGEEFFTALYRQGKRAAFVRYWGEGHVLQSPANIRDMWQRILAWLMQFGGEPVTERSTPQS